MAADGGAGAGGQLLRPEVTRLDHLAVRAGLVSVPVALLGLLAAKLAGQVVDLVVVTAVLLVQLAVTTAAVGMFWARDRHGAIWVLRVLVAWPLLVAEFFLAYAAVLAFEGGAWAFIAGTLFTFAVAVPIVLTVTGLVWPLVASLRESIRRRHEEPAPADFLPLT